jgi:ACS family hexuronate transporter-like MFS transporter
VTPAPVVAAPPFRTARFRWFVCVLLFLIAANNYLDRTIFSVLGPELIKVLHWTPSDYTDIVFWFQVTYAISYIPSGWWLDRVGTRRGVAWLVATWNAAAMLPGALTGLVGFKFARGLLGLTEPGLIPGSIKVVAEWFPRAERSFATGLYKAGSNLGAVLVPLMVPWLYLTFGWRATFFITGSFGFLLWLLWWKYYHIPSESPHVGAEERAYIESDPVPPATGKVAWGVILRCREVWGYTLIKFLTDAIWHWYNTMFPLFLAQQFGLSLKDFGLPLVVLYLIADLGSIGGGWHATFLIRRGWDVTSARKFAMLVCCTAVLPAIYVPHTSSLWLAVVIVGLANAAHQGLTSNLFTTVSDMFPRAAVGTVIGIGGSAGQLGATVMTLATGYVLSTGGNFTVLFAVAGTVYLVAFGLFNLMSPRYEPVKL